MAFKVRIKTRVKNFGIRNLKKFGIRNPRLAWIPLHGATEEKHSWRPPSLFPLYPRFLLTQHARSQLHASCQTCPFVYRAPFVRQVFTSSSESSTSGMASSTSTSETPATKIFSEQEPSTGAGLFEGDTFELTGIPLDRFVEQQFAEIFQCNICMDIPTDAVILSNCHHVYCEHCIQRWLACNGVCPSCRKLVELDDVLPLHQQMLAIFDMLTLH